MSQTDAVCPIYASGLAEIKRQTKAAMDVEPYVVLMNPNWGAAQRLGMDAVSAYVVQHNPNRLAGAPFNESIAIPEAKTWTNVAKQGGKIM